MIVNRVINVRDSDEIWWQCVTKYLLHFLLSSSITLLQFFNFASHNLNGVEDKEQGNLNEYKQYILFFFIFCITVKPVLNGISRDQNIFPLKPGFRLIKVHYIQYKKLNQDMQTLNLR